MCQFEIWSQGSHGRGMPQKSATQSQCISNTKQIQGTEVKYTEDGWALLHSTGERTRRVSQLPWAKAVVQNDAGKIAIKTQVKDGDPDSASKFHEGWLEESEHKHEHDPLCDNVLEVVFQCLQLWFSTTATFCCSESIDTRHLLGFAGHRARVVY